MCVEINHGGDYWLNKRPTSTFAHFLSGFLFSSNFGRWGVSRFRRLFMREDTFPAQESRLIEPLKLKAAKVKSVLSRPMTATVATPATEQANPPVTVATVATLKNFLANIPLLSSNHLFYG